MSADSSETNRLLQRAAAGDQESLGALLTRHEDRLRRMVVCRLDERLGRRIDPSDVIQEVYLTASRRLLEYAQQPAMPFFLWLRGIAGNKLLELHRNHLGAPIRDARREVPLDRAAAPEASSAALAGQLVGSATTPSEAAARAEMKAHLQEALEHLSPADREVLALRHFEHLTTAETAQVLGIKEAAAGKRYLRALERLREILATVPGRLEL